MAFLPGLFGGDNVAGFFGGGRYRPDKANFQVPGLDDMQGENWNLASAAGARGNDIYGQQQQLFGNLASTIAGNQPSVAQQQLAQTTQGNIAQAHALAASNPNNAGAARSVASNVGALNQQAAGQGSLLRAQEQMNAQGLLGSLLGQSYGQSQASQAGYLGQNQGLSLAQQQGNQAYEAANYQGFKGAQDSAVGGKLLNAAAGIGGAFATGGMSALGGLGGGGGGGGGAQYPGYSRAPQMMATGGPVLPVMGDTRCEGCGHMNSDCICYKKAGGGMIPGHAGDTTDATKFDRVPAMLSAGEMVLPKSIAQADDAPDKAKAFVEAIRAKHKLKKAA